MAVITPLLSTMIRRKLHMPYKIRSHSLPRLIEGELHVVVVPPDPRQT